MGYPETATGFLVHDQKNWTKFEKGEFTLKPFESRDVDVAIECCGVCGSDVHTISGGWGEAPMPLCVGHEVIGKVVRVGDGCTTGLKLGDRVGVGAQIGADLTCGNCKADQENYCPNGIDAYGSFYADGTKTQGGYSSHIRAHEYFVFKIPDAIESHIAAPMLCAGLTTYSPLVRLGCGPGKTVAILGIGGLGHFGVLWAKALGAEVWAMSSSSNKKEDAMKLGASGFINTREQDWAKPHKFKFDYIINCANATDKFDLAEYFSTLKVNGIFHNVGFPNDPIPKMAVQIFAPTGCYFGASHIGNRPEMIAMFDLAAKKGIKSWVETIDISEEGLASAVTRLDKNDIKYRFCMTGFDKVFGKRD